MSETSYHLTILCVLVFLAGAICGVLVTLVFVPEETKEKFYRNPFTVFDDEDEPLLP